MNMNDTDSLKSDTGRPGWKSRLHEIIFEADTPAGKAFDVVLILCIIASVGVVMADSVTTIRSEYAPYLTGAEWFFTILFTVEYVLRLSVVRRPMGYATSFFGVIDLLAIAPTYLELFLPGGHYLITIRVLRILRIFRILKLAQYVNESRLLMRALRSSRRKILVFLLVVLSLVIIFGSLMYLIEGEAAGFTSIPRGIYWAVVTMTTVGYGDISPQTPLGQAIASLIMILGYGIIAVPTGIVTAEALRTGGGKVSTQACQNCSAEGHDVDATHCKFCGEKL